MSVLRQRDNKSHLRATDPLLFPGSTSTLPSSPMLTETLLLNLYVSLSLCVNEKEDGAAHGAQSKAEKSIIS